VFLLLSAFIAKEKLVAIFGHNLFEDAALESVFEELLGLRAIKPFDCVGTPNEAAAALFLAARSGFYANDSMFMRLLSKTQAVHKDPDRLIFEAREVSREHVIPQKFDSIVSEL
jgi:hypothetical protein